MSALNVMIEHMVVVQQSLVRWVRIGYDNHTFGRLKYMPNPKEFYEKHDLAGG